MLFPNDTRVDIIASSAKWTLKDSCTAADVHVAVGSPSTFRLRFSLFSINIFCPCELIIALNFQ
jgi:hypothetical protein